MATRTRPEPVMGITTYDRWTAMLMAITFGLVLCVLAVATWSPDKVDQVIGDGGFVGAEGLADGDEPPAPPIEQAVESPVDQMPHSTLRETSEIAVDEMLVDVAELSDTSLLLQESKPAEGTIGTGPGAPDYLPQDDWGDGGRGQRWYVRYGATESIEDYARQLAGLGIELGAVMPDRTLVYLVAPDTDSALVRRSTESDDRLRFVWGNDDRAAVDRQLFARAGIDVSQATIVHFYSAETEATMAQLEKVYANRPVKEIRRTYFRIVEMANGPAFEIARQTYYR